MIQFFVTVFALCFLMTPTFASDFMVVEGRLTDSSGLVPIEDANVDFTLSVFDDTANHCLLYKETFSGLDMSGSKGFFSLKLGKGTPITGVFLNAMNNKINGTSLTCTTGTTYNPTATSSRRLEISYNTGSGLQTLSQLVDIGASSFAQYAYTLEGKNSSAFIQVNNAGPVLTQSNLESVFASASNVTELLSLIAGTSSQYNSGVPASSVNNNNQKIINVATPTLANDAVNKSYADTSIGSRAVDAATLSALSVGQSGQVLTWSGTQWTSSAPTGDPTKLPLAGGAMSGAINMGNQNITNSNNITVNTDITVGNDLNVTNNISVTGGIGVGTGINSAGAITIGSTNELRLGDADDSNYVGFVSPAIVGSNLIWELPNVDGTSGQVLQTNGVGQLSWITPSAGTDNLGNHLATMDLNLSNYKVTNLNLGTAASTSLSFNTDMDTGIYSPAADNLAFSTAGNQALVINPAGNIGIGVSTPTGKLHVQGSIATGPSGISSGQTGMVMFQELAANGSNFIGLRAPDSIAAGFALTLPANSGTSGQVLQTDGFGTMSWLTPAGGEINTASNQGTGGIGIFDNKIGPDIQFRNINAGSGKISVALDAPNKEIDINVVESNFNTSLIPNTPAGNIAATNLQAAINELDNEKGDFKIDGSMPMAGNLNLGGSSVVNLALGTAFTPSLSMNGDTDTGMFSPNPNELAFSVGGAEILRILTSTINMSSSLNVSGNLTANSLMGTNTNLTVSSNNNLIFNSNMSDGVGNTLFKSGSGATESMRINSTGNVGIGLTTPQTKLDVNGSIRLGFVGSGSCSTQGAIQRSSTGADLMYCDGANWNTLAKKNPVPLLNNTTTFDFSQSPILYTTNSCSALALYNLQPGVRYELILQGGAATTCTFTAYSDNGVTPITVRMPQSHGAITAVSHALYEFTVAGGFVYAKLVQHP